MSALITINEFRELYRVSRSTVYRLKDKGEIEFLYIGSAIRIRREDAEKLFSSLCGK